MPFQCYTFQYMLCYGYIYIHTSDYKEYKQIQKYL